MTLRQKVLAKQSKKGFTLVELVVVIAILAILAAIAIPAVVGIIDNAQKSAKRSNASELDAAAKKLYAGVTAGSINKGSPDNELGGIASDKATLLPAATDSTVTKRTKANALTVQNAIDYAGLATTFAKENVDDYAFSTKDGTIVYVDTSDTDTFGTNSAYVTAAAATRTAYSATNARYQKIAADSKDAHNWTTTLGTVYGATTAAAAATT